MLKRPPSWGGSHDAGGDGAVARDKAVEPLVLAVDMGSTATRGGVYDAFGRPVKGCRTRVAHQFTTRGDGTSVVDADTMTSEVRTLLDVLAGPNADGAPIAGVALEHVRLISRRGRRRPSTHRVLHLCRLTLCHAGAHAPRGAGRGQRPGAHRVPPSLELSGPSASLAAGHRPAGIRRRAELDVAGGVCLSAPGGQDSRRHVHRGVDRPARPAYRRVGSELVAAAGIDRSQLSPIHHPDAPLTDVDTGAGQWPALREAAWFPAVSDGFASNVGVGAVDEATMGATLATSGAMRVLVSTDPPHIPQGLWCYRVGSGTLAARWGGQRRRPGRRLAALDTGPARRPRPGPRHSRRRPQSIRRWSCRSSAASAAPAGPPTPGASCRVSLRRRLQLRFTGGSWRGRRLLPRIAENQSGKLPPDHTRRRQRTRSA